MGKYLLYMIYEKLLEFFFLIRQFKQNFQNFQRLDQGLNPDSLLTSQAEFFLSLFLVIIHLIGQKSRHYGNTRLFAFPDNN